jgi:hypothetical protein
MPRKPNILHVRKFLEHVNLAANALMRGNTLTPRLGALYLPPPYLEEVRTLEVLSRKILEKHDALRSATGSRKDLYVGSERSKDRSTT